MDPISYGPVWHTGFVLAELPTGNRQTNDPHTLLRVNMKWNIVKKIKTKMETTAYFFFLPIKGLMSDVKDSTILGDTHDVFV